MFIFIKTYFKIKTAIFFIIFGIVLLVFSNKIKEFSVRYDNKCDIIDPYLDYYLTDNDLNEKGIKRCNITIEIEEDMENPVYVYYDLDNYY